MKPLPPMPDADRDHWHAAIAAEPAAARCRMTNAVALSLFRRLDRAEGRPDADQQEPTP